MEEATMAVKTNALGRRLDRPLGGCPANNFLDQIIQFIGSERTSYWGCGPGAVGMTVRRLLQRSSASAEENILLCAAYRRTLRGLYLVDRNDPVCEMVARRIIEIAGTEIRDPKQISRIAIEQFSYRESCRPAAMAAARPTAMTSSPFRSSMD
jgi:hypothetical protein